MNSNPAPRPADAITYVGRGDLSSAAEAVEAASERVGLVCRRGNDGDGSLWIAARQQRSPLRIVLGALPQRVRWHIVQRGEELSVSAEFHVFRWYGCFLAGLFLLIAFFLPAALLDADAPWRAEYPGVDRILTGLFFPVGLLALAMVWFFAPLGGRKVGALLQAVLAPLERRGVALEQRGLHHTRQYLSVLMCYLGFCLLLVGAIFATNFHLIQLSFSSGVLPVVLVLVSTILVLLMALVLNPTRRAFQLRSESVLAGLLSMIAVGVLLTLPLPWLAFNMVSDEDSSLYFSSRDDNLTGAGVESSLGPSTELHLSLAENLTTLAWPLVGFSVVFIVVALSLTLSAIYAAIQSRLWLHRLQTMREIPAHQRAVGGGLRLRRFRRACVAAWSFLSTLILVGWSYALLCAVQAAAPTSSHPIMLVARISAEALAHILGRPLRDPWVGGGLRVAWVLYGAGVLALLCISVGQLAWTRRRERYRLSAACATAEGPRWQDQERQFGGLSQRAGVAPVALVLLPETRPYVAAQCFGLRSQERFVIISEGALRDFDDAELQAMLAHELVHLRQGHCRTAVLLRWLGRLTFAGDGFVLALQNSFGYEQEADRILLEESWASAEAFERCLIKMHHASPGWRGSPATGSGGKRISQEIQEDEQTVLGGGLLDLPVRRRWRLAWWLFRRQYFRAMELHYWHPSYPERLEAVRAWRDTLG